MVHTYVLEEEFSFATELNFEDTLETLFVP